MKTRTTFRCSNNLHQLIKDKSHQVGMSYNKYLNNIVATYFRDGKDMDLEKNISHNNPDKVSNLTFVCNTSKRNILRF